MNPNEKAIKDIIKIQNNAVHKCQTLFLTLLLSIIAISITIKIHLIIHLIIAIIVTIITTAKCIKEIYIVIYAERKIAKIQHEQTNII